MSSLHRVVLCADDYGLTEGVSRGILKLAADGRLSATSAMTNMPVWPRLAPPLRELQDSVAVGLHLNLTTGQPLGSMPGLAPAGTFPTVGDLILRTFTGRVFSAEVRTEIDRQLDAFEASFATPPSFIDGHQHVHVLPVVRQALLGALGERGYPGSLWIRHPSDAVQAVLRRRVATRKAMVVKALATGFADAVCGAGFTTNQGFSGFSPLDRTVEPAEVFRRAFSMLGPRPVVMCHPGHVDDALAGLDTAVESRAEEFSYLASDAFVALLDERQVVLSDRL
jgi:predicted glycoside hydrolase/deacetylase ChbG (UPF0249 family)